ncbi:MAG: polysaccharide biosynthesis protein, partial [Geminicoccaceae bacterium]|nr:polysaccharide biosynthesis protein [Geminicoccaceae bacterium]
MLADMPRVQREFRRLKRVLRGRLARNVIALYGLRAFDQLLPLLVFWYLTRTLLPEGLGLFAFANACAMYGIVIVEYGFGFSGTRAVASARDQPGQLAELITGVFAVQVLLSVVVALAAAAARFLVPQFQEQPLLLWAGLAFAILQGFNPVWYFTGQERISLIVLVTAGVKLLTTLAIFALVGAPDDSWVVLACYAGGALLATTTGYALMMREVRPQRLSRGPIGRAFRLGASLFVMRVVLMTQGAGIVILLGFLAPHHVPLYAVSDKLCRPVAWLLGPLNTALLPRLSHLVGTSPDRAQQIARLSLLLQGTAGIAFGLTIALTAPWLIDLMFGQEYAAAAAALQVMATIIPLMVLNGALIT